MFFTVGLNAKWSLDIWWDTILDSEKYKNIFTCMPLINNWKFKFSYEKYWINIT